MFGRHMTLLALKKPGAQNYFSLVRPNTGESYFDMEVRAMRSVRHCGPALPAHNAWQG